MHYTQTCIAGKTVCKEKYPTIGTGDIWCSVQINMFKLEMLAGTLVPGTRIYYPNPGS